MRYLVSVCDPKEAFMSMYHFFEGWLFEPGTIRPEDFMPVWMTGGPSRVDYFKHLLSWWSRRNADDTLLMSYRWIIDNRRGAIRRLAALCELDVNESIIERVEACTDRAYMLDHEHLFDDYLMREMNHRKTGLPLEGHSSKVRGEKARRLPIPGAIAEQIDMLWETHITPVTGHADFAAMADDLHKLESA